MHGGENYHWRHYLFAFAEWKEGVRLIVWTIRCGEHLEIAAKGWFEERGIEVWAYNENPEQTSWTESPKCYAHAYIDDAAIGCPLVYPETGDERPFVNWFASNDCLKKTDFCNLSFEAK